VIVGEDVAVGADDDARAEAALDVALRSRRGRCRRRRSSGRPESFENGEFCLAMTCVDEMLATAGTVRAATR